ncbi:MAG TPA: ATP-binding protein [Alphaproteobacteria bacterium]|nr:ATP-binding protein [Alphaproteobacteria bacterium]
MYDVIVGRNENDRKKLGDKGTIFLGRHYVKMGRTTSLSNNVFIDVTRAHVFFIVGKRGSGKSYTMGVIAEGISDLPADIKNNISVILLDTMGIYWTMKYPNQKDKEILKQWGLKSKALDVKIYTPSGFFKQFKDKGIPTDYPFSVKPSELDAGDWCMSFGVNENSTVGVFIERIIYELKDVTDIANTNEETHKEFSMNDILRAIDADKDFDNNTKNAAKNLFLNARNWGIFEMEQDANLNIDNSKDKLKTKDASKLNSKSKPQETYKATSLSELAKGGQVTVLDLSCYATMPNSWNIKNLVVGLIAEKLFIQRMLARKDEEYSQIHKSINLFGDEAKKSFDYPMVWLVIDEAHEFLPVSGKTLATDPLVTILREGRQPGISLILATQQPGKIHTDVMTQADVVIAHRITAKLDTEALGALMQSYMREGLVHQLDDLPREKGAAIIFDDNNEKMYPIKLRPRFTWHGGEDPSALPKKEESFEEEEKKLL